MKKISWVSKVVVFCLLIVQLGVIPVGFAEVLPPPVQVEGVITSAVDANLMLAGVEVRAFLKTGVDLATTAAVSIITDTSGHYKINSLPDGYYKLKFFKEGFQEAMDDVNILTNANTIILNKALPSGQMNGTQVSLNGSVKTADTVSIAISGVSVQAFRKLLDGSYETNPAASNMTSTDGNFSLGLEPGLYKIRFSKSGYSNRESTDISVTTGTQVPLNVVLNEATSETSPPVQTKFPNASGTVKTAANLAIVGVMVKAFKKIDGVYATLSEPNQATTDGNGQYSFILPTGTYKFQFTKENYQEKVIVDIVLTEGGTSSINDAVLVKYPYLITGVIKNNAEPAVGMHAFIALFKKNNTSTVTIATESSGNSGPIAETMSGSDGSFTIGVMEIGEYQLVVKPDKVGTVAYLTKMIESINIASGDTIKAIGDLVSQPGVEFKGKLVDGANNGVKGKVMVETKESVITTIPQKIDFSATDDIGNFIVVVPVTGQFNLVIPVPNQSSILRDFPTIGKDFGTITIPAGGGDNGTPQQTIVKGIVYDVDGITLVTNAYMQYVEVDANGGEIAGTQIGEGVSSTGTFGFNPQSGKSYKIKQIEFMKLNVWNRIELNYRFTINMDGKLLVNGVEKNSFNITLPSPNLIATFTESGSVIADAWIEIEHLDNQTTTGSYAKSHGKTDANGVLMLVLPVGKSYKISSIGTKNFWQETDISFSIALVGTTVLPVDLSGNANVTVIVLKDGQPISSPSYGVSVGSRTDFSKHYNKQTNSTGVASFELSPGQYEVNGLSLNLDGKFEWINVNQTFDVTAAHTKDAPLAITVNLKEPNVSGTLTGSNNLPVADAWVQFRKVEASAGGETSTTGTAGEMTKSFGASTNQSGLYKINLPAGKYVVEGYHKWDATTNTGGFTSLGIEINVVAQAQVINLGVPVPNLTGKVFKSGGTNAWSNIDLIFLPANLTQEQQMNAYQYEKRADTTADGSYSLFVPDGQYVLKAISSPTRWVEMNNVFTFTVAGGVVTASTGFTVAGDKYNIIPPSGNVTGMIVNFNGTPLTTSATGSVRRASVHVSTDWSKQKTDITGGTGGTNTTPMQWKSYGAELQENGSFELLIDTAGDYMLQDVGIEGVDTAGNPTWSHIAINKAFSVASASSVVSLGSLGTNVKGVAQLEGANVANGGVVIRSRGLTTEQMLEPWKYDKWASTNNQGAFELYLESGNYEIFAIAGANQWVEVRSNFTVAASVAGQTTTGTDLGTITVTSNVSGTVKDKNGQALGNGRVEIRKLAESGSGTTSPEQYFGAQTDSQGAFKSSLKDGNYVISGVGFENGFMDLTYPFKIAGNVMKTMSGSALDTIAIQPNILGVAKEDLSSATTIADAWITIKPLSATDSDWSNAISLHTDNAGSFGTFLAPGEYKVVNIGAANFHRQLNIEFKVNASGVLEAASGFTGNVVSGQLIIAPPAPNFKGIVKSKDNTAVANAWISVRLDDGTTGWDEDKHYGFGTNSEGKFSGKLETGKNYMVVSVSTPQSWKEYNIPFSLDVSGLLSSTLSTVVVNGELIIKPQQANVVGVVKDKDGNLLTQGWLSIKPASAGENEWSGAKWTETNNSGTFEVYLPAGNYIVAHAGNNTTWIDARTPFTVAVDATTLTSARSGAVVNNQLVVEPPSPNVVGTLYANKLGDGVDQKVANGWFSVVRIDSSNNILDRNGVVATDSGANITVSDRQNIWQHSYWYNSNAAGEFAFNQEPGTYYVLFAGGSTVNYEPGTVFNVTASTSTTLNIRPAGDNFTGVITGLVQEQLALSYVQYWIEVVDVNDLVGEQRSWFIPVTDDGDSTTTGVGKYSFSLPLGTYKMKGINSPFGFNDLSGSDNFNVTSSASVAKDVDLSVQAKVKGTVTQNTQPITTVATVMLIEVDGSNNETKKLIQTDAAGNFAFVRKEGFTYKIAKVATDSWHDVDDADTSTPALVDPITIDAIYNTDLPLNVNYMPVTP